MSDGVTLEVVEAIATLTFDRPDVLNALDARAIGAFRRACESTCDDPRVRVLVLRGAGRAFCAGGDVASFRRAGDALPALVSELAGELHRGVLALHRMDKPVLASVHGAVAGAGLSLVAASDLAIAAEGTRFTMAYAGIGASPDGGASWFLPRILGTRKALELALLGETIDAAAAEALGLVNRVVPGERLLEETTAVARRLAGGPTRAYAETRRLVRAAHATDLARQLDDEVAAFVRCAGTADLREGVAAFVERRPPRFEGR